MPGVVPSRRARFLRMLFLEACCLLLTQPVRPLFRVLRRWGLARRGVPVIFVHGYAQTCATFWPLAVRLARRGMGPMIAFDYWCFDDIPAIADRLAAAIEAVCAQTRSRRVHLVCHSMGGLVATEYLRRGTDRVDRCVTIATPHAGVDWPGPIVGACAAQLRRGCAYLTELAAAELAVPVMSLCAGDDMLFYEETSPALGHRGGVDVVLPSGGHLAVLFSRAAAEHVHAFLTGTACPVPIRPAVAAEDDLVSSEAA